MIINQHEILHQNLQLKRGIRKCCSADTYDKTNELSNFKCNFKSRIEKIRDTAIEVG